MSLRSLAPTPTVAVFRLAAVFAFLAVALGSVVCATNSGAACPTWPGCRPDAIGPEWSFSPIVEFTHRVVAVTTGPLVFAAAVLALRRPRRDLTLVLLPFLAFDCAVASGVFGRLVVVGSIPTWAGAIDLACALTTLTLLAVAVQRVHALTPEIHTEARPRSSLRPPARISTVARATDDTNATLPALAVTALLAVIALHVGGIFAAGKASYTRCVGWPVWRRVAGDLHPWLQDARLGLAVVAGALVVGVAVLAYRAGPRDPGLRALGVAPAVLLAAETAVGFAVRDQGPQHAVAATNSVIAVALLWSLGLLVGRLVAPSRDGVIDLRDASAPGAARA